MYMKFFFKVLLTILLFIFSFIYLKKAVYFIKMYDNLMQEINLRNIGYENKAKYFNINNNNNINNTNSNSNNNNDEIKGNKKSFLSRIFSIFSCKRPSNKIINKKNYELKENPKNIIIESESDCNILNSINSDRICNNNLNRRNIKRKHNIKNERRRDLYDDFI